MLESQKKKITDEELKKVKIEHKYETEENKLNKDDKLKLEKLVKQLLKEQHIDAEAAEKLKKDVREPIFHTKAPNLFKIQKIEDIEKVLLTQSDYQDYNIVRKNYFKLFEFNREIKRQSDPNYLAIRNIDKLLKNEEIIPMLPKQDGKNVNLKSEDFMKKQKRVSINYNYNFEQNKEYTQTLKKLQEEDRIKTENEQKTIKYIKENPDKHNVQKYVEKNIVVPIENLPDFNVNIEGFELPLTKKSRKSIIKKKFDTDITNYNAWRCWDRKLETFVTDANMLKVMLAPALLRRAFGIPSEALGEDISGHYVFEDQNMDLFFVYEYKQTLMSQKYFLESEEAYQLQEIDVNPKFRIYWKPTFDEFWNSMEPKEFRIHWSRFAESRKFKRWLRKEVEKYADPNVKSFDEQCNDIHGEVDDYNNYYLKRENDKPKTFYDYSPDYFMAKEEPRVVKHDPIEKPKYISFEDAEIIDYDEILMKEAEKGSKRQTE